VNIFSKEYPGNADNFKEEEWKWKVWMSWKDFQQKFEERFSKMHIQQGNAEPDQFPLRPAEHWVISKMVLSEEDVYAPTQTVNG
jgi:adenosine deaminase CECR1